MLKAGLSINKDAFSQRSDMKRGEEKGSKSEQQNGKAKDVFIKLFLYRNKMRISELPIALMLLRRPFTF